MPHLKRRQGNPFQKIGTLGGLEATFDAGKYWLTSAQEPWLLIINNADDPNMDLPSLFPEGERGHILVTTRNPNFKVHGTVGATEFQGLKQEDALTLLFRAADTPRPWTSSVQEMGTKITNTLGHLALALVHAGALIMQRICEMSNYLDFYNTFRNNVGAHQSSATVRNNDQLTVYATWEHSLDSLERRQTESCRDAAQLVSTVAFYHFDHIRVDMFTRALDNHLRRTHSPARSSPLTKLSNRLVNCIQPPAALPDFIRQGPFKTDHYRIRRALNELRSFSLISYDGKDQTFSLHPVVHAWARDRLSAGDRALWAQIAINVLSESIQLPPEDQGDIHEEYRRDILVHLDSCQRARQVDIPDYQAIFGGYKLPIGLFLWNGWLIVFREQVTTAAKFAYVYLERGRFNEAAELFSRVKDALVQSRGYKDEKTLKAMLALAAALWGLGRLEEGKTLQKIVVNTRENIHGPRHESTLSAMEQLGRSYWLNGEYKEALELQTTTLELLKVTLGPKHENTLNAMDSLGVTLGSWQRYCESRDLHERVLKIRKANPDHLDVDTLTTMNNLAMALFDLGRLSEAQGLIEKVYQQRKIKLGKEHPWTLWALCNLAKITSEQKLLKEAEDMLVGGIAAAKRSLGDDHLGVLMGVGELARIYARQGRLDEAEQILDEMIQRLEESRGKGHPDTVYALKKMGRLYEMQGRIDKAIEVCTLAYDRTKIKLTQEHPMAHDIFAQLNGLKKKRDNRTGIDASETTNPQPEDSEQQSARGNHGSHHFSIDTAISSSIEPSKHLRSYRTF